MVKPVRNLVSEYRALHRVPDAATLEIKLDILFVYQWEDSGKLYAAGFLKAAKKFFYRFKDEKQRKAYLEKWWSDMLSIHESREAAKAADKKARSEFSSGYVVGDILFNSWGYDQTNITWFQVVRTIGRKKIVLREIAGDRAGSGDMSGTTIPVKDAFKESYDETTHIVQPCTWCANNTKGVVKTRHGNAQPWDGKPKFYTEGH